MEAELGASCPAFRGCAYAVFEDLDLTDFGNRIPALTFEVLAGDASTMLERMLGGGEVRTGAGIRFPELSGFSHEAGSMRDIAQLVDRLHPLAPRMGSGGIVLAGAADEKQPVLTLPHAAAWDEGEFGKQGGFLTARDKPGNAAFASLRYYDPSREYQAGLQHAENAEGSTLTFQFPGAFSATDALALARRANGRAAVNSERLMWRCAELDPAIQPGALVRAPGIAGTWLVASWEWREAGIELELLRHRSQSAAAARADPGEAWSPPDRAASPTQLRVFEAPWDGSGSAYARNLFAAATAADGRWAGAAIYAERDGGLTSLGKFANERAIGGRLVEAVSPSHALRFEWASSLRLQLIDHRAQLATVDLAALAQGANRLLVGGEVVQFARAEALGEGQWILSGLLRGRGGTEIEAAAGHEAGTEATLLDERLVALSDNPLATGSSSFAAIGVWDSEPAVALVRNAGTGLRPPAPVHGSYTQHPDGSATMRWIRRARGQWTWLDEADQPLVEETEAYEIGYGPVDAPLTTWSVSAAALSLPSAEIAALRAAFGDHAFWVRQRGSFARSRPSLLGTPA